MDRALDACHLFSCHLLKTSTCRTAVLIHGYLQAAARVLLASVGAVGRGAVLDGSVACARDQCADRHGTSSCPAYRPQQISAERNWFCLV